MSAASEPPAESIVTARLRWDGDQPFSQQYGDIYHAADGVAEVHRVFVDPQRLDERLTQSADVFTVGELGFGSGLNFAVAAELHGKRAPPGTRLHFISFEKHPLTQRDFASLAARRSARLPIYAELAHCFPPAVPGWHRRHLRGGSIVLSVFFGDAALGLADIERRQLRPVDAWFLDGFAPDRNPAMWRDVLWRAIAGLSGHGTTVATFSAVGSVRRALMEAGFTMRRIDQRPHKRHTLAGEFAGARPETWRPVHNAAVVGAGLAGAATARQLAERGIAVRLYDDGAANRMAATLLHCRLPPERDARAQSRVTNYLYAAHWWDAAPLGAPATGALQFPRAGFDQRHLERVATAHVHTGDWVVPVDAATAGSLLGQPVRRCALYFPHARTLDLRAHCDALVHHPLIELRSAVVHRVTTNPESATVTTRHDEFVCDHVVLCTGAATNGFDQARYLELVRIDGQTDLIATARAPAIPIVGNGFALPLSSDCAIGATYEHRPWSGERATEFNRRRFETWWTDLTGATPSSRPIATLRGGRAVTSDRVPIVGALFDAAGTPVPRLSISAGHGSHGTVTAPFAAECIAAEVAGEFAPCRRDELERLGSLRFRVRQARRGLRHGARE